MAALDRWLFPITLSATLGCGLMAGLFFTFSVFVMQALAALPAAQGMAAMKSINVVILNPLFLLVFLGTAAVSVYAVVFALRHGEEPGRVFLLAGGLLYLAGSLIVTMAFNVPMNDALASANAATPEGVRVWTNYLSVWTAWNHVRTAASLAATAAFALALHARAGQP